MAVEAKPQSAYFGAVWAEESGDRWWWLSLFVFLLHYSSGDTGHVGFLQDSDVGTSVLPGDPQNLS